MFVTPERRKENPVLVRRFLYGFFFLRGYVLPGTVVSRPPVPAPVNAW